MFRSQFVPWKLGGLALAHLLQAWMHTLNYRVRYEDRSVDPALPEHKGPGIYLFWHEYIPFPFYLRCHCHVAMLLSQHRDAEILSYAARYSGFQTVRGSTTRGGVRALRTLMQFGTGCNLAITPDGPQGPRRQLAPGCIFLASKLQLPLILVGFGYDRPWRYRRVWDHFAIPRPGSRARALFSKPIAIPQRLDRDILEWHRLEIERALNAITLQAEEWAWSGRDLPGSEALYRAPAYHSSIPRRALAHAKNGPAFFDPEPVSP